MARVQLCNLDSATGSKAHCASAPVEPEALGRSAALGGAAVPDAGAAPAAPAAAGGGSVAALHVCPDFDVELRRVRHGHWQAQAELQEELAGVRAAVAHAQSRAATAEALRSKCSALRIARQSLLESRELRSAVEVVGRQAELEAAEARQDLIARVSEEDAKLAPGLPRWLAMHGLENKEAAALQWCSGVSAVCIDDILLRFDSLEEGKHLECFVAAMKLQDEARADLLGDLVRERRERVARRKQLGATLGRRSATTRTKLRLLEGVLNEYRSNVTKVEAEIRERGSVLRDHLLERLDDDKSELRHMHLQHQNVALVLQTCNVVWVVVSSPIEDLQGYRVHDRLVDLAKTRGDVMVVACTWPTAKSAERVDGLKFEEVSSLSARWQARGMSEGILEQIGQILRSTLWFQLYAAVVKAALHTAARIGPQAVVKAVCILGGPISRFEASEVPVLVQEVLGEGAREVAAVEVAPFASLACFRAQLEAQAAPQAGRKQLAQLARASRSHQLPTESAWLKASKASKAPKAPMAEEPRLSAQLQRLRRELWAVREARGAARAEALRLHSAAAAEAQDLRRRQLSALALALEERDRLRQAAGAQGGRGGGPSSAAGALHESDVAEPPACSRGSGALTLKASGARPGAHDLRRGQDLACSTRRDDRLRQALLRSHTIVA